MNQENSRIPVEVAATCDGGNLDCGSGLLLIIRSAMAPIAPGHVLEIRSSETSVKEDLPAWCRMVGHDYLGSEPAPSYASYYVRKGHSNSKEKDLREEMDKARHFVWTARARKTGPLEARVYVRNHDFTAGQPASFREADESLGAVDYLLGALAADLAVSFGMHASRREIDIDAVEAAVCGQLGNVLVVSGLEDEGNPGFETINATLYVQSSADDTVLQEIWEQVTRRSPLVNTLKGAVTLNLRLVTDI